MEYTFNGDQLEKIERVFQEDFQTPGLHMVVLIDMAGNVIAESGSGRAQHDLYSLAALAAGNFGAVSAMAQMIGEKDFSLLFHQGENECIHFSKVLNDFLLVTMFNHEVSLGFLRLKATAAITKLEKILGS